MSPVDWSTYLTIHTHENVVTFSSILPFVWQNIEQMLIILRQKEEQSKIHLFNTTEVNEK